MAELKTNLTQKQLDRLAELITFEENAAGVLHIQDVKGTVGGDVKGNVLGSVLGDVWGNVEGDIEGDVWGNVKGDVMG
jgi:outer membrane lipoprotein SlyB